MRFIKRSTASVPQDLLNQCSQQFNISPKIMEQIILRGNDTVEKVQEFLNPTQKSFLNPFDLDGMQDFVNRIQEAKEKKQRILVFGDYDVDGISATSIMLKTLKVMGINAKFFLPNRYVDGYGLTNDVIKKIKHLYNPNLIITVDCGISCHDEVEFAKTIGIDIVVTDHHEIPEVIPNTIVLNAKLPNQKYAFNGLCGTGLAYKISEALIGEKAKEFLPIACLATVADIVPLISENRAIVFYGLKCLNKLPIGLRLLFKKLDININKATSMDISFKLAPKINASGRMGDAQDSLKLYLTEDVAECHKLIAKILGHNDNRKDLCSNVEYDCKNILTKINVTAPSIILSSTEWDQGILGIICAKLVNEYNRPVFLFSESDGEMKGSARSIAGINIHKLLSSMQDILVAFGGHPVAAGLTIKSENFNEFISRVNRYLLENYSQDVFVPKCEYDIEISSEELTSDFLRDLNLLEPCGCENESLKMFVRAKNFTCTPMRNYYEHCNIVVDGSLNLVKFDCLKDYPKLKYSNEVGIVFELQYGHKITNVRGIIKAIDCDIENLSNIGKMEVIPYLEQIKFSSNNDEAHFTVFTPNKDNMQLSNYFGTAIVVNSEYGYNKFNQFVDKEKIVKLDICDGSENSGLNVLVLYPRSLEFTKFYEKVIFLDAVSNMSYISQINKISNAQVLVVNDKPYLKYFEGINCSRENFGLIFKDISKNGGKFTCELDLFMKLRTKKFLPYSFKDFYSAFNVFIELGLISIVKVNNGKMLKINNGIKTELSNSQYYTTLENLKNNN